ncbi:hypothetical protein GA0070624_2941 [Micromonospora rhizosphaerae]|uniref:Uncharacterized protein n=1 Tax=Micromonospora rhizosphaerae TaxID=568872 RepID=A0A1C6S500_9ACTN|nr:hypothetical protein GA0070624_2941 [Micromonospora rhizosphaerae]
MTGPRGTVGHRAAARDVDCRGRLATAPRYQWAAPVSRPSARDQYVRRELTRDAGVLTMRACSRCRTRYA